MGTFTVSLFLAFGIGPLLGGPLADRFGMSAPFIVMGSLAATAFLLVLLFLPELGVHKERWKNRVPVGVLLAEPVVIALLIFRTVVSFGRGVVIPFLPFVAESRGASLSMIGVLLATNILLAGLLQIPFGRLADRVSRPFLMALGIVASAVVIFAIPYCTTIRSLFFLQAATGTAGALGFPAGLAMATQCGRRFNGMGTMMAIYNTGMSIGLILGPLGGGLVDGMFGLDNVFRGGSLVVAAGFVAFLVLMRRARVTGSLALLEEPEADEHVPEAIGRPVAELAGRPAS